MKFREKLLFFFPPRSTTVECWNTTFTIKLSGWEWKIIRTNIINIHAEYVPYLVQRSR